MRTKTRYRKLQAYADGGAVEAQIEAPIPNAPQATGGYTIPEPVIEPDELDQAELPASAKAWLRQDKNSKYLYDEQASAKLADLHFKVVDEGHEPYSPSYWKRLEARLEQPPASTPDVGQDDIDRVLEQARRSAPKPRAEPEPDNSFQSSRRVYSAPPSRSVPQSNGRTHLSDDYRSVVMSPAMREAAKLSGIDEATYAKGWLELQRRKERGEIQS
jgi:hypothetical protein